VAKLALRLFDDLREIHRLDEAFRQLLWAAALLHDAGVSIGYDSHHLHSSYIVLNSLLPGYTPRERVLISLLTRYHRSRGTPKAGEFGALLQPGDEDALTILAGILRICEYLERGRHQVIPDAKCHFDKALGWVQIEALANGDARMELWDAGRNVGLLAAGLGMEVEIVEGVWSGNGAPAG
jgi:exopolyphosphatase/guanosine-5'-triphosphate,3'-diphosphate pyrophosphatase